MKHVERKLFNQNGHFYFSFQICITCTYLTNIFGYIYIYRERYKWSPIDNNDELTQQMYVDNYFTCLTNALHISVRIAKDECNASFKGPKRHHWWNKDC